MRLFMLIVVGLLATIAGLAAASGSFDPGALFGGAFVIAATALGIRLLSPRQGGTASVAAASHRALEQLNDRFAMGELDRDEYLERRAMIES